ncbi:MAG: YidC/Oxa1 family membrane protein insertase [Coriobacteriia bacterium]|nr:YidC/Oxa1 family membrane protein insertase [Coriobacteriia bacterium]
MWNWFLDFIYSILQFFVGLVSDWGIAIVIVTVILRLFMMPLTLKQQKSMAQMQKLSPKLKALQERYKDDPQRLNEEMMKFYSENKFNPIGGCLPILIQMPVFIALFQVLRTRVPGDASFMQILPWLTQSPSAIFTSQPLLTFIPYLIFVILFGSLTLIPMLIQPNSDKNMKYMAIAMSLMMLWFGWVSPAGVLLFWVISSGWGVIQQLTINKKMKLETEAELEAQKAFEPVEVDVVRRVKKNRPRKKN